MDDQADIKFLKQQEFNANIVKRLEELEDLSGQFDISGRLLRNDNQILRKEFEEFKKSTLIRLDQGVENRTKAFERIAKLENSVENYDGKHRFNKDYSFQRRIEFLEKRDKKHKTRIDTLEKQVTILKELLDQYFTLEINNIKDSHGKRKV